MGICLSLPKDSSKLDERSQLKPKKRKVDKSAIGLPSNFQHLQHGGADGTTSQPGTTKSQFASLKNKMDDFARLLGDFDGFGSKNVPSNSSDGLTTSEKKGSTKNSLTPNSKPKSDINNVSLNSSLLKTDTTGATLKTFPSNSKLDSRTSVKELFEDPVRDNDLTSIVEKNNKSINSMTPTGNFTPLELPLEIESSEKPVFSNETVTALLNKPSEPNKSNDMIDNHPISTHPTTSDFKDQNNKTSEESIKDNFNLDSVIDIANHSTSQEKLMP